MTKPLISLIAVLFLLLTPLTAPGADEQTAGAPEASFSETAYTFQPVVSGSDVSHSFVVRNKGTATLEIQRVNTG